MAYGFMPCLLVSGVLLQGASFCFYYEQADTCALATFMFTYSFGLAYDLVAPLLDLYCCVPALFPFAVELVWFMCYYILKLIHVSKRSPSPFDIRLP